MIITPYQYRDNFKFCFSHTLSFSLFIYYDHESNQSYLNFNDLPFENIHYRRSYISSYRITCDILNFSDLHPTIIVLILMGWSTRYSACIEEMFHDNLFLYRCLQSSIHDYWLTIFLGIYAIICSLFYLYCYSLCYSKYESHYNHLASYYRCLSH